MDDDLFADRLSELQVLAAIKNLVQLNRATQLWFFELTRTGP